jgi:hypothetical protein
LAAGAPFTKHQSIKAVQEQIMTQTAKAARTILCPSVTSIGPDAKVFGVLTGSAAEGLRVGYLTEALPATPELLAAAAPARPTEVFRAASPCMERGCKHFDGANCQLAKRITAMFDPVVSALPRCAIRPVCRWFRQEGREACLRCPLVATEQRNPSELQQVVAG